MTRRAVAILIALVAALAISVPATAAAPLPVSATSWRATLVGASLRGGATTLLQSDGRGSVNVKVAGVPVGEGVIAYVIEGRCGTTARTFVSFPLRVDGTGTATARMGLTVDQVAAYRAARKRGILFSVRVVTFGDAACGNQAGVPSVGTLRRTGAMARVFTYDIRVPLVGGLDPQITAAINTELRIAADATVAAFVEAANAAADPSIEGLSTDTQTFTVTFSQPMLLSIVEHEVPDVIGAPHGDEQFQTFTFDLATGRRIRLQDLFRPGSAWVTALSQASIDRLRPTVGAFAGALAAPIDENFAAWSLVPGGIGITFAQAQGFAVPITTIRVPLSALRDVLDPISPIGRLLPQS